MMSVGCVVAWGWLGVFSTMICGHVISSAEVTTSSGENQQLQEIKQMLTSMQQVQSAQSLCSAVGSRSDAELVKNNLLIIKTKLEATEVKLVAKLEVAETKLQAIETRLEAVETKQEAVETKQEAMETKQEAVETKQEVMETKQEATSTALQSTRVLFKSTMESGSTFVRWGRKTCTNSSQVVYTGVAGGSHQTHSGAAANLLCLTLAPQSDSTPSPAVYGLLYGAEYETIANRQDHDVPCSVCRAAQSTSIMIPATHACPVGWTMQYTGHLVTGHYNHAAAREYNCLDVNPEQASGGARNDNGYLLYHVIAQCGSLPCPPYVNKQVVLCVVCSK